MKRVDANFATPSRPARWHWVLVIMFAVGSAGLLAKAVLTHDELVAAQLRQRQLQAQIDDIKPASTVAPVQPYDSSAREMLHERDAPWPELLTALETVSLAGIAVTGVDISTSAGRMSVQLTAADYQTALEYLAALNGDHLEAGALGFTLQQARAESNGGILAVSVTVEKIRAPIN